MFFSLKRMMQAYSLFYIFQLWEAHRGTAMGTFILWAIPPILGILGPWPNRHLIQNHSK